MTTSIEADRVDANKLYLDNLPLRISRGTSTSSGGSYVYLMYR